MDLLYANRKSPFGSEVRFRLIDFTEIERDEIKTLGTYGVIKGATLFIVGAVMDTDKAMEDYGYSMERNILLATNLGLGTCWLGGTFKRSAFAQRIKISERELVPAVSPVGYAADKRTTRDSLLKFLVRSKKRKPWNELFYCGDLNTPLEKNNVGGYAVPLEAVRLAPSASNLQPWRIVKEKGDNTFHFCLKRAKKYYRAFKKIDLQKIDIGIAMCHFELSAHELELKGSWKEKKPDINAGEMEYVASWEE